jgi:hypothetical protein
MAFVPETFMASGRTISTVLPSRVATAIVRPSNADTVPRM